MASFLLLICCYWDSSKLKPSSQYEPPEVVSRELFNEDLAVVKFAVADTVLVDPRSFTKSSSFFAACK